ncbi:histidine kinase [Metarhizobium album]|uniref:histidine kinase n=1 Tax=Metarhizobium album TaxID=2182425 RepID=A0A2U2DJN5_9HYPH|nr:histidine kinase [Rhizobium album]
MLPAIGMLTYNELLGRQQRDREIHQQALQAARQAASEVNRIIEGVHSVLIAAAAIPAVFDMDRAGCTSALKRVSSQVPPIRSILVFDLDGKLVCDSFGMPAGMDFSERSYIRDALAVNDFVVGEYTISKLSEGPILPVAMPLRNGTEVKGIIATGIRLEWLDQRIRERGITPGGVVTIADRNGIIIARNPESQRFVGNSIAEAFKPYLTAPRAGTTEMRSPDGTLRIVGYEPVSLPNSPLYIGAGISKEKAFADINRTTLAGVAFILLGALIAVISAVFVGNRFILRPIDHIVDVLQRWRGGDVAARTNMGGRYGELGLVGASVDHLLDELDERRRQTEKMVEARKLMGRELAHRVKNTLSIVQAIARQTFGRQNPEEFKSFSQRIGAFAGGYDILLADDWESGDLREVIDRALLPHLDALDQRISLDGPSCHLSPPAVLSLSMIIHELATNATKYGALSDGTGSVRIEWAVSDGKVKLTWNENSDRSFEVPSREGFGSRLIRSAFPAEFEAETHFSYEADGLKFSLSFIGRTTGEAEA